MIDILDVINEATKEANAFENHAAKELSLEERVLYLQGLALVMNADGDIDQKEKEYLRILIKSFEMYESILDSLVEFAQTPDKDTVQAFFRTFRRRPIAQLFLFDALMMTRRDDNIDEREKAVVDKIAEQLEVLKGTYQDIYDLFCHIKNKDWDESALYFSSHLLNPEHFKHLLDYFEVNQAEFNTRTDDLRKKRLQQYIQNKLGLNDVAWNQLSYTNENLKLDGAYITTQPITNLMSFTYEIMIPYLQCLLDRGEGHVNNDSLYFDYNGNERSLINLTRANIYYDKESRSLSINNNARSTDDFEWPQELIFKLLNINEDVNVLEQLNMYIKGLGLSVGWVQVLEGKVYFPALDGTPLSSASYPSSDIGVDCKIMIASSDGSMNMNSVEDSEHSWMCRPAPCLGYLSHKRMKDIGGSSSYHYSYNDVKDGESSDENSYYLQASTLSGGVPDDFAICLPERNDKSANWVSLKGHLTLKDLLNNGLYVIR